MAWFDQLPRLCVLTLQVKAAPRSGQDVTLCQPSGGTLTPSERQGGCAGSGSIPATEAAPGGWRNLTVCWRCALKPLWPVQKFSFTKKTKT